MSDLEQAVENAFQEFEALGFVNVTADADYWRLRDALVAAVESRYRSALAGETEQETLEKAVEEAVRKAREIAMGSPYGGIDLFYARLVPALAPILRALLLARIKELEAATKELRQGCGRYYITQETAFAPGIVKEWPKVIKHPKDRNGRLVMRIFPGAESPVEEAR